MLIFFTKSQLALFDAPVHVGAHVRKDGTVVKPHVRIQKVAVQQRSLFGEHHAAPPVNAAPKRSKLDTFLNRYGGPAGMARILADLPEGQQQALIGKMAEVGKTTPEAVADMLAQGAAKGPAKAETLDLFSQPHEPVKTEEVSAKPEKVEAKPEKVPEPALPLVEHVTKNGKGKTLRGVVRTDLTQAQAKEIDPYTFRKDGGWFIREKHLTAKPATRTADANTTDRNAIIDTGDKLADYWANSAGASILRDVKAGRTKKVTLSAAKLAQSAEPAPAPAVAHDPTAPFGVAAGTSKTRRREINAGVVDRLAEGGPYTADDLAMFRQYSGNGGCGDSLNEFYTDPGVARAMWTTIANLGITSGTALEPSCATGVFLHTAPAGFKVTGVELDPTSAAVAQALHGDRHEIHTASLERFAKTDNRQFKVVIGNPPYGPRGYLAKDDKKAIATAEQYFTDTALDKCEAGGIVALVVPTGIMDSKSARAFRQTMLCKGEFLGAQRMPNTAFEHSHTEVTTDVIYLRKRADDVAAALGTVDQSMLQKLGVWDEEFLSGSYFTGRGAENVLGTMTEGWRAKAGMGNDITVEGSMEGVADAIATFQPVSETPPVTMGQVLEALGDDEKAKDRATSAAFRRPYSGATKVGDTRVVDGVTYILQGDPPRWHRVDEFMQTESLSEAQRLAGEIDRLMTGSGAVDRPALEAAIRAYVEKHGNPNDDPDVQAAARADKTLYRLIGAVNRKGELSDVVRGQAAKKTEAGFDTTAQVMALERSNHTFSPAELAERLGKPVDEVTDQLVADPRYAFAGGGQWTTMDAYLTGELWPKLDAAKAALEAGSMPDLADKLKLQAQRLEETIGPKSLDDVEFQLNSAWVPMDVVAAFFNWKQYDAPEANEWTKKQAPVEISFADGVYKIQGGNQWGDSNLLDKYLNRTGIRKEQDLPRVERLNDEFKEWLCASTYRDRVEDLYNRNFRGFVAEEFSNAPMDVPGLNPDKTVRDWRWSSLRKSLADGKGIIADDVGLGKTLGGLLLARMAKVNGQAKRPTIVVPKSVLANWFEEAETWFPGAKVLTIGANFTRGKEGQLIGKDDTAAERKRKYHDLTQNDYDFIIISEPAFEEVDLDPVAKEEYYSQDFWVQRGESLGNAGDKRRKAIRERYEQHIAQREFSDRTDAIYFNELGVDMLIADEMHHQKNLYSARARFGDQPKFLGGQGLSNRALDFNLKTRWVRENNGGKNVYGLTATPTKNSPLEIYSMLSHIAPEAFEKIHIRNSEEFLDRFCEFQSDKILSTGGAIEEATVVSGFKNLDELREIMSRYIDRRTAVDVGLQLPERDDRMHLLDMSPAQQQVYAEFREKLEESAGKKDATGDAHIFSIMDKMNKAALDLSLLDPKAYAGSASPKYAAVAEHCREGAKEGGQIIFSEYIDSHDKIVAALVDAGFKREEIGIINAQVAGSAVKRQNIANAFNAGKLKVVVGNATMAEGLNMQKTTTDIHHMDVPWEPATLQQRNGRGLRQGNMNKSIRIHAYLSKGSFDGYRYQAVAAKKDWQDLLWNGGDRVENLAREGNFSPEEMRIMMAADPEEARRKYQEDKEAATQRYETGQRADAQKQFVRFREMSRSYGALKNKATASGERLRRTMESLKTALFNNKYWPAKAALTNGEDVLIHPDTGTVLTKDVGMEFPDEGRMVVTGVNMQQGMVSMRRYADTGGARTVTVPLSELTGAKPFKFDSAAEADEVGTKLEEQANAKLNNLTKWEEVKAMPSAVLEKNHDLIQRQIKEAKASYKGFHDLGDAYMVEKATGKIEKVPSYSTKDKHETHDYLLPTDANKEKAIQAWVDARREARISSRSVNRTRGRGSRSGGYDVLAAREYPGADYLSRHINPMKGLLDSLSGEARYGVPSKLENEAKSRLQAEQVDRIRRAKYGHEVMSALYPLAKLGGKVEGGYQRDFKASYPKDALAIAWARLRHLGELDDKVGATVHDGYAHGGESQTKHAALIRMARASGHEDLADAFAATGERHGVSKNDKATLQALAAGPSYGVPSMRSLQQIKKIAERMGIMDSAIGHLESQKFGLGGKFAPAGSSYGYGARPGYSKKFSEALDEAIKEREQIDARLAAKEAA